ncbi:MAG: hypothetical protein ACPLX7_10435 [Candidatus Kapaibacteriota bacterium]
MLSLISFLFPVDTGLVRVSEKFVAMEMWQKETGWNRGFCEKYQKALGLPVGSAYCYAGQYWAYEQASKLTGKRNPLPRTGLAVVIFYEAKKIGIRTSGVKRSAFVVWRRVGTSLGHVERVKEVGRAGWVETYAFNVEEGTKIKKRNIKSPIGRKVFLGVVNVVP